MGRGLFMGIVLCFLQCVSTIGGTSTETTNGLCLSVDGTKVSGTTSPGVVVTLCASKYNPCAPAGGHADSVKVGADGTFAFMSADTGIFNLVAVSRSRDSGVFIADIPLRVGWKVAFTDTFKAVGAIRGTINPDTTGHRLRSIAFLPGTTLTDTVNAQNRFLLKNIPAGNFFVGLFFVYDTVRIQGSKPSDSTVSVKPGDTTMWVQPK
jgi:hypothetical protein